MIAKKPVYFRKKIQDALSKLYPDIRAFHSGDLVNRLTGDVSVITDAVTTIPANVTSVAVRLICAFSVLVFMQWQFAVVFAIGGLMIFGITRLLPGISESEAILHGTLTEQEKDIYRAVFYTRTATSTMLKETEAVKDNAKLVESKGAPQLPMLLFISDGSGGTAFDKDTWRSIPKEYIAQVEGGEYIELDCPHYVHDHEYQLISEKIREFLAEDNT